MTIKELCKKHTNCGVCPYLPICGDRPEEYSLGEDLEVTNAIIKTAKALQHCEDCISRQAALDIYDDYNVAVENGELEAYRKHRKRLLKLPSVQPKIGHWIPVSDRLPKSAGVYIVTREFTDGFECANLTDACYFDGTSTWHNDNRINHGREYVDKKIKAWMPLPEPYKAESEKEMTKAELMSYVGKKVHIYFKDGEKEIYGTLGYADEFSVKHDYRKPNYFYIGNTSFKASHVKKLEEIEETDERG